MSGAAKGRFEKAWKELAQAGYIKVYKRPDKREEYELLSRPARALKAGIHISGEMVREKKSVACTADLPLREIEKAPVKGEEGYLEFKGNVKDTPFCFEEDLFLSVASKASKAFALRLLKGAAQEVYEPFLSKEEREIREVAVNGICAVVCKALKGESVKLLGGEVDSAKLMDGVRAIFGKNATDKALRKIIKEASRRLGDALKKGNVRDPMRYSESIAISLLLEGGDSNG